MTDRNHPARVSGSDLVLEPDRSRTEGRGLQGVLQPISVSYGVGRTNAGAAQWRTPAPARALRLISLATALQGLVSDPDCCLNWNSPHTGVIKIVTSTWCRPSGPDSQFPNSVPRSSGTVLAVAIATASLGSDNVTVYAPMFALQTPAGRAITVVCFLVMRVWCAIATWLVRHPVFGPPIRRWGSALLPALLIGLGVTVMVESGSFRLLLIGRSQPASNSVKLSFTSQAERVTQVVRFQSFGSYCLIFLKATAGNTVLCR